MGVSSHEPGSPNLSHTGAPRIGEVCASCGKEGAQGPVTWYHSTTDSTMARGIGGAPRPGVCSICRGVTSIVNEEAVASSLFPRAGVPRCSIQSWSGRQALLLHIHVGDRRELYASRHCG